MILKKESPFSLLVAFVVDVRDDCELYQSYSGILGQNKSPSSPLWAGTGFPGTRDCALMSPQQGQEYHPELFRI